MTNAYDRAMQRLTQAGFRQVTADSLPALCRQSAAVLLLLQGDSVKYPEVADSWVIAAQLAAHFASWQITPAVASLADSGELARQYRIIKFPALLCFRQQRLVDSISGLLPWQEYIERIGRCFSARADQPIAITVNP